jgi:hypothetical protein
MVHYAGQTLLGSLSHRGIRENARSDELAKLAAEAHAIANAMVKELLPTSTLTSNGQATTR